MAQKLTLTEYLRRRGAIKALTKIEADAFGIPWPLQSGWPFKFAGMEVTQEMLADLTQRVAGARHSTARKAQCGLDAATGAAPRPAPPPRPLPPAAVVTQPAIDSLVEPSAPARASSFPGFVLRQARRYRLRGVAPR